MHIESFKKKRKKYPIGIVVNELATRKRRIALYNSEKKKIMFKVDENGCSGYDPIQGYPKVGDLLCISLSVKVSLRKSRKNTRS